MILHTSSRPKDIFFARSPQGLHRIALADAGLHGWPRFAEVERWSERNISKTCLDDGVILCHIWIWISVEYSSMVQYLDMGLDLKMLG